MAFWRFPASLTFVAALVAGQVSAAAPGMVVEVFREGCLGNLPDFSRSERTFKRLRFEMRGDRLETTAYGGEMNVELGQLPDDMGPYCLLQSETPFDPVITQYLAEVIANMTENHLRHEGVETDGARGDRFVWRMGDLEVQVHLTLFESGSALLGVAVGEAGN